MSDMKERADAALGKLNAAVRSFSGAHHTYQGALANDVAPQLATAIDEVRALRDELAQGPPPDKNEPPREVNLTATNQSPEPGEVVEIHAAAVDPEGGPLAFAFEAPPGVDLQEVSKTAVKLTVPTGALVGSTIVVRVEVTDQEGAMTADTEILTVGAPSGETSDRVTGADGFTWVFDKQVRIGKAPSGVPWIALAGDIVSVREIIPPAGQTIIGSMRDPQPLQGTGAKQAIDAGNTEYDATLRVDTELPYALGTPMHAVDNYTTIVAVTRRVNMDEQISRSRWQRCGALTVYDVPPADGTLAPPWNHKVFLADEHRRVRVPVGTLPKLPVPASMPDVDWLCDRLQHVYLDLEVNWTVRNYSAIDNWPDYGREYANLTQLVCSLLCLDIPVAKKQRVADLVAQHALWLHGIVHAEGVNGWAPDGGHASGRKLPYLVGMFLMSLTYKFEVMCGEDAQTFFVGDDDISSGRYQESHRGMAEWGIRHATYPQYDSPDWSAPYRQCCTANAWGVAAKVARLLGLVGVWEHDAFFAYVDRYLGTETAWRTWSSIGAGLSVGSYPADFLDLPA